MPDCPPRISRSIEVSLRCGVSTGVAGEVAGGGGGVQPVGTDGGR